MRKLILSCLMSLLCVYYVSAQRIMRFGTAKGSETEVFFDVHPTGAQSAWLHTNWGMPLHQISSDSVILHQRAATALNPAWNAPIAYIKTIDNQQILISRLINGFVHPFFGIANGGLLFVNQNNNFNLVNHQNTFSLLGVNDAQWYAADLQRNAGILWIGGDSGVRKIILNGFNTRLYRPNFYGSNKGIVHRAHAPNATEVWLGTYSGDWLIAKDDTITELKKEIIGLNDQWFIDKIFTTASGDTLFLGNTSGRGMPLVAYHLKNKLPISISTGLKSSILHLESTTDGDLWMAAATGKLYRKRAMLIDSFDLGINTQTVISALKIGENNRKWVSTIGEGIVTLDDVNAKILPAPQNTYCLGSSIKFADSSITIGRGIASKVWQLDNETPFVGDSFVFVPERTGKHTIVLTVSDINGSSHTVSWSFTVKPLPYLRIIQPFGSVNSCKKLNIEAYGWPNFHWITPSGSREDTTTILATQQGKYFATAEHDGCTLTDSIEVNYTSADNNLNILLKTSAGTVVAQNETLITFPPSSFEASIALGDVCHGSWLLNGNNIGDSTSIAFTINQPGLYTLRFNGINQDSCARVGEISFNITTPQIPNLITANGDNLNDKLLLQSASPVQVTLFNRWGKAVLQTAAYENNWPTPDTPSGVYYYRIQIGESTFNGWIQVVK